MCVKEKEAGCLRGRTYKIEWRMCVKETERGRERERGREVGREVGIERANVRVR